MTAPYLSLSCPIDSVTTQFVVQRVRQRSQLAIRAALPQPSWQGNQTHLLLVQASRPHVAAIAAFAGVAVDFGSFPSFDSLRQSGSYTRVSESTFSALQDGHRLAQNNEVSLSSYETSTGNDEIAD